MLRPKTLQLEVTNDCNQACHICMRSKSKRRIGYISFEGFSKIPLEKFKEIAFHGWGEPFLHPDLFRMIDLASERGVETSLITNGTLLDRRMDELIGSSLDSIAFGIFTTKGKERVFENIRNFVRENVGIDTYIDITILPNNLNDIAEIVKFAGDLGIDVVLHKLFYAHDPNLKPLSEKDVKTACKVAKEIGREYGIKVYTPPRSTRPCAVILSCIFMGWDLTASPCCFLHEMGYHYPELDFNKHLMFMRKVKTNEICRKCPW